MNILGIDPSGDGKHCCVVWRKTSATGAFDAVDIFTYTSGVWYKNEVGARILFDIIILELPVPQGIRSQNKSYTALCFAYGKLRSELLELYPKARVFEVPANVIRRQAGWTTRCGMSADKYVSLYLKRRGFECGRGTLFNSTHKRDALMCALFNWEHVMNAEYEVQR